MSFMQCSGCPTKFVVGLLRCPRCGQMSELYAPRGGEGEGMPKISVEGGPSNAGDPEVPEAVPEPAAPATPEPATEDDTDAAETGADEQAPEAPAEPAPVKTAARATKKTAAAKP